MRVYSACMLVHSRQTTDWGFCIAARVTLRAVTQDRLAKRSAAQLVCNLRHLQARSPRLGMRPVPVCPLAACGKLRASKNPSDLFCLYHVRS